MEIKWLRKALQNLDREAEYIAKDDPMAARHMVERIIRTVTLLQDNPALGRPGRIPGTHELVIPNTRYLVPYHVSPKQNQIVILRVFHTARKRPGQW